METMIKRFEEIEGNMEKIGELSPDEMEAWGRFSTITEGKGALSPRGKEIISVALSVLSKCEWCIAYHVKKAIELGARKQEIIESAWIAVLMGGSPALMHAQLVLKAVEEFGDYERMEEFMYYPVESSRLFQQLLGYVDNICDEVERVVTEDSDRRRLALNFAESDSRILERLVKKECDNRGWEEEFPEDDYVQTSDFPK